MGTIRPSSEGMQPVATRRRGRRPAPSVVRLPPPPVEPVPGTDAARSAADEATLAARRPPHVLLSPHVQPLQPPPRRSRRGMSSAEIADRIVAVLLRGSGPILLCVPGTRGATWETSMLATARAVVRAGAGPVSAASIPYANGVTDIARRLLGSAADVDDDVLAHVLRRLRDSAPHRPVLLAGESQGAWLAVDTLRAHPELAATVDRLVLFARPGFVDRPPAVGGARAGAALLSPGSAPSEPPGVLEVRHTDDVVPGLFRGLGPTVAAGLLHAVTGWLTSGSFDYRPHHYDRHGQEAAHWLLQGRRPASSPVHPSTLDR